MWRRRDNIILRRGDDRLKGELNSFLRHTASVNRELFAVPSLSCLLSSRELGSSFFDSLCIIHGARQLQFSHARSCEEELKAVRVSSTRRLVWIDVQINGCVIQLRKKTRKDDGVFALTTAWIALHRVLIYRNPCYPNYEIIIYFIICTTRIMLYNVYIAFAGLNIFIGVFINLVHLFEI